MIWKKLSTDHGVVTQRIPEYNQNYCQLFKIQTSKNTHQACVTLKFWKIFLPKPCQWFMVFHILLRYDTLLQTMYMWLDEVKMKNECSVQSAAFKDELRCCKKQMTV